MELYINRKLQVSYFKVGDKGLHLGDNLWIKEDFLRDNEVLARFDIMGLDIVATWENEFIWYVAIQRFKGGEGFHRKIKALPRLIKLEKVKLDTCEILDVNVKTYEEWKKKDFKYSLPFFNDKDGGENVAGISSKDFEYRGTNNKRNYEWVCWVFFQLLETFQAYEFKESIRIHNKKTFPKLGECATQGSSGRVKKEKIRDLLFTEKIDLRVVNSLVRSSKSIFTEKVYRGKDIEKIYSYLAKNGFPQLIEYCGAFDCIKDIRVKYNYMEKKLKEWENLPENKMCKSKEYLLDLLHKKLYPKDKKHKGWRDKVIFKLKELNYPSRIRLQRHDIKWNYKKSSERQYIYINYDILEGKENDVK